MKEIKIKIMDAEEFCVKANNASLIRGKYKTITPNLLLEIGFSKKIYNGRDIFDLNNILKEKDALKSSQGSEVILSSRETIAFHALLEILYPEVLLRSEGKRKHYSLLTIFRLIPKVNTWIKKIRKKYNIDPNRLKAKIYLSFPEDKKIVEEYIESGREFNDEDFKKSYAKLNKKKRKEIAQKLNRSIDHRLAVEKNIEDYISENFSNPEKDINPFCVFTLKSPRSYIKLLRNYILFEKIDRFDTLPIKSRSREPEIDFVLDSSQPLKQVFKEGANHFEPYISLKIFGNTKREDIEKKLDMIFKGDGEKNFMEYLPSYNFKTALSNPKITEFNLLKNAICFFLFEEWELKPKEIENIFKKFGRKVNRSTISRDINAFKHLFKL